MNNNFTPEEKLRIIDLLAVTQSKKEFLDAVNKLLSIISDISFGL